MRRGFWLALLLLAGGGTNSWAAGELFGAIAWSLEIKRHGYAYDYPSSGEAEARALQECRKLGGTDCIVVLSLRNECGALASGERIGYGARGANQRAAELRALEGCRRQETNCRMVRAFCTGVQAQAEPVAPSRSAPTPETLLESLPDPLKGEIERALRRFDFGKAMNIVIGFVVLIFIFRILKAAAGVRKRLEKVVVQAAKGKRGGSDWILDRYPSLPPKPSRETGAQRVAREAPPKSVKIGQGPIEGAIVNRETRPPVQDMNRQRRHVREGQ